MICIYCASQTNVKNSRHQKKLNYVWRRRYCVNCRSIFTTVEQPDLAASWVVIHQTNHLEPFLREKLFLSIFDALLHRKTALKDSIALTNTVISSLNKNIDRGGVKIEEIGKITSKILKRFDKAAAAHYLAYHQKIG